MAKRLLAWVAWVAVLVLIAAGVVFGVPGSRVVVLGYLNGEPFHENLPRSYYVQALKSPDGKTRQDAAFALGVLQPTGDGAVSALADALGDHDALVRINAALSLYKLGPAAREALPALIRALADDIDLVRMDAAMALARIGPDARQAVPALVEALQRQENRGHVLTFPRSIREQMADALGRIGPDAHDAVPVLCTALTDEQAAMRDTAAQALERIDPAALRKAAPDRAPQAGLD
jgi:HEAT repeat protein